MTSITQNPRVSVVIPTYNRADLLPRAIGSVLSQTFNDFELIIVDDGSTDDTKNTIEKLFKDGRIKYFFKENTGQSSATNFGMRHASGDYIALLDSDDEWTPEKLKKQMAIFEKDPLIGAVFCWLTMVDEATHTERVMKIEVEGVIAAGVAVDAFIEYAAQGKWFSNPSAMIFKKSHHPWFDERLVIANDIDFTIELLSRESFFCVGEPLVKYYVHGGNISRVATHENKIRLAESWDMVVKKHKKIFSSNPTAYSAFLRGIGSYFLIAGNRKAALRHFIKAAKLRPLAVKNYFFIALVPFGGRFFTFLLSVRSGNSAS